MRKIALLLLLFSICSPILANDLTLSVGTSVNYLNINDKNYQYTDNELKLSGVNLGASYNFKPIIISVFTNRLLLQQNSRQVISKKTGNSFENRTRTKAETLMVGYQVKRFIPAVFIANTNVDKALYKNDTLLRKTKQSALLCGANITYIYDKNFTFSTSIIAPNEELGLDSGLVFGVNYNFSL